MQCKAAIKNKQAKNILMFYVKVFISLLSPHTEIIFKWQSEVLFIDVW